MIELRVHTKIAELSEISWDGLLPHDAPPFLRWAWLDALERTGCVGDETGWTVHHLSFHENGELVGVAPAYLKSHGEGEFVFDHSWAHLARRLGIPYYPKLIVAVPFTPATGPRLLAKPGHPTIETAFGESLRRLVEAHGISSAHVLFPEAGQASRIAAPDIVPRRGVQFHWHNRGYTSFDDFLASFNSKRRNQIRRELRAPTEQGVDIATHRGRDLTPEVVDAMYRFYLTTVDKFVWGRRYLNRSFFEDVCDRLRNHIEIVMARQAGRPIAGAFNLVSASTLYGRYWGATQERPFLHFNVCYYHSIAECIRNGKQSFEPGAGGEHKLARGFDPTLTHSLHHFANPRFGALIAEHLQQERRLIEAHVSSQK